MSAHGAFLGEPLGSPGCSLGVTEGPRAMPGRPGVGPWGPLGGFMGCLWMILGVLGGPWGGPWAPRRVPGRVFKRSRWFLKSLKNHCFFLYFQQLSVLVGTLEGPVDPWMASRTPWERVWRPKEGPGGQL